MKTVVITGAGSGIGRATAALLAERGWQVVATDRDADAAERTRAQLSTDAGQRHEAMRLDVTDPVDAARVADDVADRLGLDAWVSNAGVSLMGRFLDMPLEAVETTFDINLKGVYITGQAAARAMVRTGRRGKIANTASMAAKQGNVPFLADYVASKFGVLGLTQAMAHELAEFGITVNCVCPGFVVTPMHDRELEWEAGLRGITPEEVRQGWIDVTPLGRLQQPEDVARGFAFLLSEDADFITGEALSVNGGVYMD